MRNLTLFMLGVFLLVFPSAATAQSEVKIAELQVQLWPEYDHPTMLVIYTIVLADDVTLPATVGIRIPAGADINAVAEGTTDSGLMNLQYETTVVGDWQRIETTTQGSLVQIEYYDPGLEMDGAQRHFEFTWAGDYAVESFTIRVQQPFDAFGVEFSPLLGNSTFGGDGLTYYDSSFGKLQSGEEFNLTVNYRKGSDTLTVTQLQSSTPSTPVDVGGSGIDWNAILPWGLGILGLGLIGFGGYRYWQSRQDIKPTRSRAQRRPGRVAPSSANVVYCHNCGQAAGEEDKFCRNCGTKLRR